MKAKSDCAVSFARGGDSLRVRVESTVGALFGRAIEAAARAAAAELGADAGELAIEDDGALDFVVAARVEAALRAAGFPDGSGGVPSRAARPPEPYPGRRGPGKPARRRYSRLYLPGNQPDLFPNAGLFGADCLVLDLEDSVPQSRKDEARILVRRLLESGRAFFRGAEIEVRINPPSGRIGRADLAEIAACLPDAVILPKCESAAEIEELDLELGRLEESSGLSRGTVLILPLVETARGALAAPALASASPRVAALCFGAEDFARDIGARRTAAGTESLCARQAIVLAAKAAGIQALDSAFSDIDDEAGLAAYCAASRAMGFDGAGLVHPRQIPIAHRAFAPSEAELEEAGRIVAALEEAESRGSGVASLDGRMIDAPVAERARRIVDAGSSAGKGP